jgi:hypothetical protein
MKRKKPMKSEINETEKPLEPKIDETKKQIRS